jgi:putative restriction endonuclease
MSDRIFGEIPGISVGRLFANREELSRSGVHRPRQAGISGAEDEGADSIVLSGGYEDDEDFGDLIVYTGHGGQDRVSGKQIDHQTLTRQNLALAVSRQQAFPVRVVRGANHRSPFAPEKGYRYDGLYYIERFWHDKGAAGFTVWRFSMVQQSGSLASATATTEFTISPGNAAPGRMRNAVSRVIRDAVLSGQVKIIYDFSCQVCGTRLKGPAGPYAEAAHIRPLGRPHDGPDTADNLLCLCPNHHYLFDVGAFGVRDDLSLMGLEGRLRTNRRHVLNLEHLRYHREHFGVLLEAP